MGRTARPQAALRLPKDPDDTMVGKDAPDSQSVQKHAEVLKQIDSLTQHSFQQLHIVSQQAIHYLFAVFEGLHQYLHELVSKITRVKT